MARSPHEIIEEIANIDFTSVDGLMALQTLKRLQGVCRGLAVGGEPDALREAAAMVLNNASNANGEMQGTVTAQVPVILLRDLAHALPLYQIELTQVGGDYGVTKAKKRDFKTLEYAEAKRRREAVG